MLSTSNLRRVSNMSFVPCILSLGFDGRGMVLHAVHPSCIISDGLEMLPVRRSAKVGLWRLLPFVDGMVSCVIGKCLWSLWRPGRCWWLYWGHDWVEIGSGSSLIRILTARCPALI